MKKINIIVIFLSVIISIFGCKNNDEKKNYSVNAREIIFEDSDSTLKEELLFYTTAENYKLTEEETYNDLLSFLALRIANYDEEIDYSRAISIVGNQYDIQKAKSFKRELPNYNSFARGMESSDEVNFSIYDISNTEEGTKGVAITSDDERIGSLLCILDDIDCTDTEEDPVLEIFLENLDNYVEDVSNELENITEDDLELFKEKYNITDEEIAAAKLEYENSLEARKFWGYDSWSSWSVNNNSYNNLQVKTKWYQKEPYNNAIKAMENNYYITGCGATALAQIMAYHEYPLKYTRNDLSTLKSKWSPAANWNGIYDWKAMKQYPKGSSLSPEGKVCLGALMYDVSKGIKSKYGPTTTQKGTNSNFDDTISYLHTIGYTYDNIIYYSYSSILSSLKNNCPVLIRGNNNTGGHAWIIDGSIELQRTRNYYVFWIPFKCKEYQDYVHCNYGWEGTDDEGTAYSYNGRGYYKSGVFASDLNQNVKIISNIKPIKK